MSRFPTNSFPAYHAHVYFDAQSIDAATGLVQAAGKAFGAAVEVGRIHCKPVGPHPDWSCQLAFEAEHFDEIVPWLAQHRAGLNILVHGLTGDDWRDHTEHAAWLGEERPLKLEILTR
ncbi:MAG: DOPA 4,5-dioxygenase family protein [Pseudomonadota bacterium]